MAWMSEEQAATVLGVPFRTIRRRVGNGSLRTRLQGSTLLVEVEVTDATPSAKKPPSPPRAPIDPVPPAVPTDVRTHCVEPIGAPVSPPSPRVPPLLLSSGTVAAARIASPEEHEPPTARMELTRPDRRAGLWARLTAWGAVAVALAIGLSSVWVIQQTRTRLRAAQSSLADARNGAERARIEHEQAMSLQAAKARSTESALTAELGKVRRDFEQLKVRLDAEQAATTDYRRRLDLAAAELAARDSRLRDLGRRVAFARGDTIGRKGLVLVAAALAQADEYLQQSVERLIVQPPARPAETETPRLVSSEPQDRALPRSAPTLTDEDRSVSLRPILR